MTSTLLAPLTRSSRLATFGVIFVGSWLLAASSWIETPMWPVPMTAQTYAVLLIGAACGARLAAATVVTYLVQGALGLPMFAGGAGGVAHLLGPTGGFLVGFLISATLVGWLLERGWGRNFFALLGAMAIGHALVFITGVAQLSLFVGMSSAIAGGFTPFIVGSIVKVFAAAATIRMLDSWLHRAA